MWSHDTGKEIKGLEISSNGEYIVVSNQDELNVFNTTNQNPDIPIWTFPTLTTNRFALSSNGEVLAAGNSSNLWLFNISSNIPLWNYTTSVNQLAISGDGHFIITANGYYLNFFRSDIPSPLWEYNTQDGIYSLSISHHAETFIVGSQSLFCFYRSVRGTGFLDVDIVEQDFSLEIFDITFSIHDINGEGIDSANVLMSWDGNDVSSDVQNLGYGIYSVLLDPITVSPGESPILLNMTLSVGGYNDTYYEIYLAVDPNDLKTPPNIPGYSLELILCSLGVVIILLISRKKLNK